VQPQNGTTPGSAAALTLQFPNLTPNAPLLWMGRSAWAEVRAAPASPSWADASGAAAVTLTNSNRANARPAGWDVTSWPASQPLFDIGAQQSHTARPPVTFSGTLTAA